MLLGTRNSDIIKAHPNGEMVHEDKNMTSKTVDKTQKKLSFLGGGSRMFRITITLG